MGVSVGVHIIKYKSQKIKMVYYHKALSVDAVVQQLLSCGGGHPHNHRAQILRAFK